MKMRYIAAAVTVACVGFGVNASAETSVGENAGLAQDKLDLYTRAVMAHAVPMNGGDADARVSALSTLPIQQNVTSLLITVENSSDIAKLQQLGAYISGVYGDVVVCEFPTDAIGRLNDVDGVLRVTTSRRRRLLNDKGRAAAGMNVDKIHTGTELTQPYLGDGVVVGVFDGGLDPNHINFQNDDQTSSRVKRVWNYKASYSGRVSVSSYTTPTAIAGFTTDDSDETHGTHVLGTIAGSYNGGTSTTKYYGMAPHADIAIACGDMSDASILAGVQNIVDYAASVGKPTVINMSLGTNCGHHDGTDAFSKALDVIAKDTPIILAAGNEADLNIVARKTFDASDTKLTTAIYPSYYLSDYPYCQAYGNIEVISDSATPFTLQIGLYNKSTQTIAATLDITSNKFTYWGGSSASVSGGTKKTNTIFTGAYDSDSYIGAAIGVCPDNGRYYALIDADLDNKASNPTYYPVIIVKGSAGQTVELFTDAYTEFANAGNVDFESGITDGTISDMACGQHTISVGAYVTRSASPYTGTVGDICFFSSYGKLIDGRELPDVCAPGQAIVSSMSKYYRNSDYFSSTYDKVYSTVTDASGKSNYWCHMQGTSMATPGVTGVVALWLDANPDLTPAQIRDIAKSTARTDAYTKGGRAQQLYQWGAGKIDAYTGIKKAIEMKDSGVGNIAVDNGENDLLITATGLRSYEICRPGVNSISAQVYSVTGAMVANLQAEGDTVVFDGSLLPTGIYVVACNGISRKIVVR